MDGDVRINLNEFDLRQDAILRGVAKGIRAGAFAIQEQALVNIEENDSIDTGAMRNSVYVETDGVSEREEKLALALAAGAQPGKKSGEPGDPRAAIPGDSVDGPIELSGGGS
jgi:hypothetical protein